MASDNPKTRFLFLAGVGRSGTTILRRSIGLHPQVYYNGRENNLIQDVIEVAQHNCKHPSRKTAMVVTQTEYDRCFRDLLIDLIWPDTSEREQPVYFAAINPLGNQLDYLRQIFPATKIIGLVRSGIEVICSRMKYESFSDNEFITHCQTWIRTQSVIDWGIQRPDDFFLFRHEWMYQPDQLKTQIEKLLQWAQLDSCESIAQYISNYLAHPSGEPHKSFELMDAEEKREYFAAKSDQWRHWSAEQRKTFQEVCGEFMQQLGYRMPFG